MKKNKKLLRSRDCFQGTYKLIWTQHASDRLHERFPNIEKLEDLTFPSPIAKVYSISMAKEKATVSIREGSNYYNIVVAEDTVLPKTLNVITVVPDTSKLLSIITDLF